MVFAEMLRAMARRCCRQTKGGNFQQQGSLMLPTLQPCHVSTRPRDKSVFCLRILSLRNLLGRRNRVVHSRPPSRAHQTWVSEAPSALSEAPSAPPGSLPLLRLLASLVLVYQSER